MKQFLLYFLYVGILFIIQIVGLLFFGITKDWPFWKTDVGSFFETIHLLFYMVPAGLFMFIAAIAGNATAGLEGDPIPMGFGLTTKRLTVPPTSRHCKHSQRYIVLELQTGARVPLPRGTEWNTFQTRLGG